MCFCCSFCGHRCLLFSVFRSTVRGRRDALMYGILLCFSAGAMVRRPEQSGQELIYHVFLARETVCLTPTINSLGSCSMRDLSLPPSLLSLPASLRPCDAHALIQRVFPDQPNPRGGITDSVLQVGGGAGATLTAYRCFWFLLLLLLLLLLRL